MSDSKQRASQPNGMIGFGVVDARGALV